MFFKYHRLFKCSKACLKEIELKNKINGFWSGTSLDHFGTDGSESCQLVA